MLKKINASPEDRIILIGDYMDRGPKSYEMLRWLETRPANVECLLGNHDEDFIAYIDFLNSINHENGDLANLDSPDDLSELYLYARLRPMPEKFNRYMTFDAYQTIMYNLISYHNVTLRDLTGWAELLRSFPLFLRFPMNGRDCIAVHAGYRDPEGMTEEEFRFFCVWARDEAYLYGGVENGLIIAGHTPTIANQCMTYTGGEVFRYYNKRKNCLYYDIDCGCVYRERAPQGKLACIRLEDEQVFYV